MKTLLRLKSIVLLVGLGLIGALAQAANGVGPYYATPAWDQTLPATTRFLVLTNMSSEAVLDRETGLVWEKSPDTTTHIWYAGSSHCLNLEKGGRKGWRMPTVEELASLVDPSVPSPGPTLPAGHPFAVQSSAFWSATTFTKVADYAWFVDFGDGDLIPDGKSLEGIYVWCVRGGKGPDAQ